MDYAILIVNIVGYIALGLIIRYFLTSYMTEKGKNLATKEDITEITEKSEKVLQDFRKDLEEFTTEKRFKNNFNYEQYSKLYTYLYAIICQSEYVRHIIRVRDNQDITFEAAPFVEIGPTIRTIEKVDIKVGKPVEVTHSVSEIESDLSKFNKKALCDHIINHGEFASQKLLKLAISYRFAYSFYSGNQEIPNPENEYADTEEFRLIREIVECIVIEYNMLRRELKMDYSSAELDTGRFII